MKRLSALGRVGCAGTLALAAGGSVAMGCGGGGPQVGSQTNWFVECSSKRDCGDGLSCLCGHCTQTCESDASCADLPGASCLDEEGSSAVAVCGGQTAPARLCMPRCTAEGTCAAGSSCVAGVCLPSGTPTAEISIDPETRFQTLIGFGAGVGYTENAFVTHSANAAIREALYVDAGLDAIRLRNRFEGTNAGDLSVTAELLSGVEQTLGRRPVVLINSSSPPGALKESGQRQCSGDAATCTLRRDGDGAFDYPAFGAYWRASLDAYADAGVAIDYFSLQNNPNIVPSADSPGEGCFLLPEEGTTTIDVDGMDVTVPIAGYREALAAVRAALADLSEAPRLMAPETSGIISAHDYASALDSSEYEAISVHLYGVNLTAIETARFEAIGSLASDRQQPVLQSEMAAGGLETATLMHHALVHANASAYLQNELTALGPEAAPVALLLLTEDSFEPQLPYYSFAHFARHTDPGWIRVAAPTTGEPLLVSSWIAPDDRALSVVLVNPADHGVRAHLSLPADLLGDREGTSVLRTVFDGVERFASLGPLPSDGSVRLPPRSMVTVVVPAN